MSLFMTNAQVIAELQKLPPDDKAQIFMQHYYVSPVCAVKDGMICDSESA